MKNILLLIAFLFTVTIYGQTPLPTGARFMNATKSDTLSGQTRIPVLKAENGNLLNYYTEIDSLKAEMGVGTDANAIHDNEAGEINAITEKVTPVSGDVFLMEDSEDGFVKRRVAFSNLPFTNTSEWAKYTGTQSGGDLRMIFGDYTFAQTGNVFYFDIAQSGLNLGKSNGTFFDFTVPYASIAREGLFFNNATYETSIIPPDTPTANAIYRLPTKSAGTYTLATTDDISGGGAVSSVNSQTGDVILDADDIDDTSTTNKFVTGGDLTNLGNLSGTNTGDVTLAGTPDYITISGQTITRNQIDLTTDVTGDLPLSNIAQQSAHSVLGRAGSGTGDVASITAGNNTILSRSGSGDVAFNSVSTLNTMLGAVTLTDDQTITGTKTFDTGDSNTNIISNNAGASYGIRANNTGSGSGIYVSNTSTTTGIGIGIINSATTSNGRGLVVLNQDAGNAIVANGGVGATGFNFVGQNNGATTFSATKEGNVTGNSFTTTADPYDSGWNADNTVPTKNDVYDEMEKKISSDTTSLGNVAYKPITNLIIHDYSVDATEPTLSTNEYAIQINAPLAKPFTGTAIPLDDYYQKDDTSTDTGTWTLGTQVNGGAAEILINISTEPTITGATQITGTTAFEADTLMLLTVKSILGTAYYFFTEL